MYLGDVEGKAEHGTKFLHLVKDYSKAMLLRPAPVKKLFEILLPCLQ